MPRSPSWTPRSARWSGRPLPRCLNCSVSGAFAHLAGVAPIPASSGRTHRHRLNRGGDRAANNALHTIVLTRMRFDARTRDYVDRRTKEGLNKFEVQREPVGKRITAGIALPEDRAGTSPDAALSRRRHSPPTPLSRLAACREVAGCRGDIGGGAVGVGAVPVCGVRHRAQAASISSRSCCPVGRPFA
ncbi:MULTISPECIES: transposase [unclassified Streptomyces]|uniref:transposase n=1 Tax=unclassified Streptomyces TaxID=2593676 RepID=UPI0036F04053